MRTRTFAANLALFGAALAALAVLLGAGAVRAEAGPVVAGAAKVDASWHVGASAGQYAGDCATDPVGSPERVGDEDPSQACAFGIDPSHGTYDPTVHSYRRAKSYGLQSRLEVRALVVKEGEGGTPVAIAKTDLYIPQDLLYRRAAQLLETDQRFNECGVRRETLTMATTHNHSSPMYSSTSWGVWAFQDVFDIRFYNYMAERIAEAVTEACRNAVPVRVGASVGTFDETHRHSFGPALADDGTPAGYPNSETDHDMTVIRFDDVSDPSEPEPIANLVNFSLHPEFLEGNNLISADYVGPLERMTDRATGALTIWTQGAVGTAEPERSTYHSIHERLEFSHKDYAQAEYGASLMSNALVDIWDEIGNGAPVVPFATNFPVLMQDRWYPGPLSHPYPGVSNCRTDPALEGDPRAPIVGLPDCTGGLRGALEEMHGAIDEGGEQFSEETGLPNPTPPFPDPGLDTDDFQARGIPVPENYSAPSYTGLEEDIDVHLQGIRLGEIYLPICSCEQWFDQSKNIETRTNKVVNDEWVGYDWAAQCEPNPADPPGSTYQRSDGSGTGTWLCPNPGNPSQDLPSVSDHRYMRMRAQVNNPANGWNDPENVAEAESEPVDTTQIKGNYTHDDDATSAARGYTLTVPISMANDYNGYIATYREYQRGDHYRKALTGWGPHASDYMATRLVTIGRQLKAMPDSELPADQKYERDNLAAKVAADQEVNNARAEALGVVGTELTNQYEEGLPDDGGAARPIEQPAGEVERFGAAFFTWNGGSNYTDSPTVVVEREVGEDEWETFADQSGELPLTLEFPEGPESAPSYLEGGQEWHWTTHFEAFVAPFDVGSEDATPAGTYRFLVQGERRSGGEEVGYEVTSDEFEVKPWDGITADDVRVEPDGRVSFAVGPRTPLEVPADNSEPVNGVAVNADGPAVSDEIGPIDYPDSYSSSAPFVRELRTAYRDPAAPGNPDLLEWFCFTCSFRPWLDAGDADTADLTFVDESGETETVPAAREGDRWVSERPLAEGESAFVSRGGVLDPYGNLNGEPSPTVGPWDTTPPDTQIDAGPEDGSSTTETTAMFEYSGQPAADVDRFECGLDGAAFGPCPADGIGYIDLQAGAHTFAVRAIDAAGNFDQTPAGRSWTVEEAPSPGDDETPPGDDETQPGGGAGEAPRPNETAPAGPGEALPAPGPGGPPKLECEKGTRRDDRLDGGARDDCLKGGGGNDRLKGGPGNDVLDGGPGNDVIVAGPGVDSVICGPGRDTARVDDLDGVSGCERVRGRH